MKWILFFFCLLSPSWVSSKCMTLGTFNNNFGNVSPLKLDNWPGAVGYDNWGHAKFASNYYGLLAIKINLKAYWRKYKINTVHAIAYRWAKGAKDKPRDLKEYEKAISEYSDFQPKFTLDMTDPYTLESLARGIVHAENSCDEISDYTYKQVFHKIHYSKRVK